MSGAQSAQIGYYPYAMESLLSDTLRAVREHLLRSEGDIEPLLELGTLLRDVSRGWSRLPEEARSALQLALQSAQPLNAGAMQVLLEELSAHQKAIGRAAAQAPALRYPPVRELLRAYQQLTDTPATAEPPQLNALLLAAELIEPDADLTARAETLIRTLYAGQPFAEYNASLAVLAGLAFLQANGRAIDLEPTQAASLVQAVIQGEPLVLPATPAAPDPRVWDDILESLIARYRQALVQAEHELQETRLTRLDQLPAEQRATLQPAPGPRSEWRYLTLQDLVWINSEVTRSPQPYSYDRLEEATYYQYSYRQSRDIPLQAARFLWGYLKYRPFARGNLATALIATLAFLHLNGYETHLPPEHAADWLEQVALRRKHPLEAVRQIATPALPGTRPESLRELVHHLIEVYEAALHQLAEK